MCALGSQLDESDMSEDAVKKNLAGLGYEI